MATRSVPNLRVRVESGTDRPAVRVHPQTPRSDHINSLKNEQGPGPRVALEIRLHLHLHLSSTNCALLALLFNDCSCKTSFNRFRQHVFCKNKHRALPYETGIGKSRKILRAWSTRTSPGIRFPMRSKFRKVQPITPASCSTDDFLKDPDG